MRQISPWLGRRRRRVWERCQTGCCLNGGSDFAASASSEFTSSRCVFQDFGDNALIFESYFWINSTVEGGIRSVASAIRFEIYEAFEKHGIEIAFPQRDVHIDGEIKLSRRETDRAISGVGALILASSSDSEAVTIWIHLARNQFEGVIGCPT